MMHTEPLHERWKPLRGGLINIFRFEDQVFRYENGRLLLRGDNGSGKSRVLALQLPFLLDGDMSPYRVEPDRDPAKRMEWHLLMDRHERRTGYTWIEFGRVENGQPRYLTLGCGMEAQKGGGSPKRWFFISPHRVETLRLVRSRVVLGRRQLMTAFEEGGYGRVFDKTSEYRIAVDDALFKLGARYAPLIDLLIQLRQPQLMRDMKEDVLSDALSEALPPVGDGLIQEVAESFQGLDSDRQHYEEHREMLHSVETFRDGYRQYLAASTRRLCEGVRVGHSQFEHAARDLRKIEQQLAENSDRLAAGETRTRELNTARAALEAEVAALKDSPEMRSKRDLEEAMRRAEECEAASHTARAEWDAAERHRVTAAEDRSEAANRRDLGHRRVEQLHGELAVHFRDIAEPDAKLFEWESAEHSIEQTRLGDFLNGRHKGIAHLREGNAEIGRRQASLDRERDAHSRCRSAADEASERAEQTQARLQEELAAFGDAAARWEQTLVVLHETALPRGSDWGEAAAAWLDDRSGDAPLTREIARARERAHREIAAEQSEVAAQRRRTESEMEALNQEHARLRDGVQPEPIPPSIREPRPADRPGAPFWRWCEFLPEIPEDEHAGWEAALQSAGLLDAWVYPDGSLGSEDIIDDVLALNDSAEVDPSESLAAVLRPATGGEAIACLLRRVGNRRDAAACWVAREGHWANHVHAGHGHKAAAEFLGHRAREAARLRRMAAVEDELRGLQAQRDALSDQGSRLDRRLDQLAAECDAAPSSRAIEDAAVGLERDQEMLQERKAESIAAEQRANQAEACLSESVDRRNADAEDMGMALWSEPDALEGLANAVAAFEKHASAFWPAWQRLIELRDDLVRAESRETAAAETAQRMAHIRDEQLDLATRARTRATTLREAVGATVEQLIERLERAESAAARTREACEQANQAIQDLRLDGARLDERRIAAHEKRSSAEAAREHAVKRMETFAAEKIFGELDADAQPDQASFSPTAAVELARRLEQRLREQACDDDVWNRLQSQLTQSYNELNDQLGRHGHHPLLRSVDESSTHVITCEYQGRSHTMSEFHRVLDEELHSRERIFEEREREVIENHLIGEAAIELQRRIRDGEAWVTQVNDELDAVPTSSGIRLKFAWDLADPHDDDLKAVRRLFLKTSATWTPAERESIGKFLQERIRAARESDDTVGWREHLGRALDYRAWHRFSVLRKQSGEDAWKKLTKRTFGTGSGGEKAMTLTVPQFAAAAAHYRSAGPHAPRLILLDEAFVAIDAPTRAKLMGLLETFDLDYVMTSEREWGTYPTVSALAIYQLATRPGYNAIAVTRWIWNGREKTRDEAAAHEVAAIAVAIDE